MKAIIIEGIATSGKSSLIQELKVKLASELAVCIADEAETHIPIMKKPEQLHIAFYEELIDKLTSTKPELLIFDRLYLTQAFRANTKLIAYASIENRLRSINAMTIFLKVEPTNIEERVQKAITHREPEWGKYVSTKGDTPQQQAEYYIAQQESQLELLTQSRLPYTVFDTTEHPYPQIADKIVSMLKLRKPNNS